MNNLEKPVKIRIEIGRPKRKSGVYVRHLYWGLYKASRRMDNGITVRLKVFQRFQIEEGPGIFDGLKFSIIPCDEYKDNYRNVRGDLSTL